MSKTVDERIVSMQFDNKQFESNVSTSMSTLEKLKQSLKLTEASKGLENIGSAAKSFDMSPMANGIETVRMKFSALEVMAVTALANITNSVVNSAKRMVSSITIQPIKDGFAEYETQMNAVQTILANTQKEGTNVKIVNAALDDLNRYADKTIYNFTEMTRNIGTFTAAGVKLDTSLSSIKGIANLAAISGSSSQQASTAMYQLSQAIASGTVKLMDWNSVVNAGMGGQVFQDALIRTSEHLQTGAKAAIDAKGSFRESLQTGWLTTDVLTQTLDQFATAADTQEEYEAAVKKFVEQGYSQEEARQMADMARTAGDAATKVKTFSQLIDTLKEALGSGWTETWRTIIGDFEEARELWTSVSDVLSDAINKSSDARNAIVKEWAELGGRNDLIESFKNVFEGVLSIAKPIREAFSDIFPPITAKNLIAFTEGLKNLTAKIKISDETAAKLKSTFSGLFSVASMLGKILLGVGKAFGKLITSDGVKSLVDLLLSATAAIGDFLTSLNNSFDTNGLTGVLTTITGGISNVIKMAVDGISKFGNIMPNIGDGIIKAVSNIWNAFKTVFGWIKENFSAGDLFAGLAGGGIFVVAKKLWGLIDKVKEAFENLFPGGKYGGLKGIAENFSNVLESVHDSLESFTVGIKATTLLTIAAAIGILSASLKSISKLDGVDIAKSLGAIGAMFVMLSATFKSITKTLDKYDSKGLIKAGASILIISFAIKNLASAMVKLSSLSLGEIGKGLYALGVGLAELCLGMKYINKVKIPLSTSVAMLALAESCKILADALTKFGQLSWDEIKHGLVGMGGALGELVIALKALDGVGGMKSIFSSVGILIIVQTLSKLADNLKKFGQLSWDEIKRGLVGMGGALAEVSTAVGALGKITGFKSIFASGAIFIVIQGLSDLADALQEFGNMSWDEIKRGLVGMGGALAEVATMSGALGKLAGFKSILGSGSILLLIQGLGDLASAFGDFAYMSWDEIKHGLVGMGGALTEVATVSGLLGSLTGFSGILGSGSILLSVQGLGDLADAFKKFGEMSWDEIKRGLVGMGGALTEVATVTGLLGSLAGLPALLGSGSILLSVQGLGDLADAFKKFGEMSWDEITRGLTSMNDALSSVAIGGLLNTLSGLGAVSISTIAEPLGTLADSIKKWSGVTVPEGLGVQLGILANGIMSFTFDGFGASALATAAPGVGIMADSVRKWAGVTVPEGLGGQLAILANGISSFTFGGWGAEALVTAAPGIGAMADSVRKWSGVTIPEGLGSGLQQIANGVKAFTWAFVGGISIETVIGPLGDLASSIRKWNGVTIPEGLETGLKQIASGVKSFSLAFVGGWTLNDIIAPLGDLATAVKKWNGVKVPEGISDGLQRIASGVKSFSLAFVGGWTLSSITGPLGDLATAVKKWNGVTVPSSIGIQLSNLSTGVKSFVGIGDISGTVSSIGKIASSVSTLSGVNFSGISTGLSTVASSLKSFASSSSSLSGVGNTIVKNVVTPLQNASSKISSAAKTMMSGLSKGITSSGSSANSAMNAVVTKLRTTVISKASIFNAAGKMLMSKLASGISSQKGAVNSAVSSCVSGATSGLRAYYGSFYSAGIYLASGFADGISAGTYAAAARARAMAQAAYSAAKQELDINSPSKLFRKLGYSVPEGFAQGIERLGKLVGSSSAGMAQTAYNSTKDALSRIDSIMSSDLDTEVSIHPVLDLGEVRSKTSALKNMFSTQATVGVNANLNSVNKMMNRRNQNGSTTDVISAIDKLRRDIKNINNNTYTINGITYDDGSGISDAIEMLIRAAKIERRV